MHPRSVHLLTAYPERAGNAVAREARDWVAARGRGDWRLAPGPDEADLILFLEDHPPDDPLLLRVLRHPVRRRRPSNCWVFHDGDRVFPILPGIYPALERRFERPGRVASWCYVYQHCPNPALAAAPATGGEPHLYSFMGARRTHPVRACLLALRDDRAALEDTSAYNAWELGGDARARYHERYARTLRDSKFVLCPRGISPTSYRLLETMECGRVPVIISDAWPLPHGPAWEEFALVVAEQDVAGLPAILRQHEPEAPARGRAARAAWETWFADPVKYGRLLDRLWQLATCRQPARRSAWPAWKAILSSRDGWRLLRQSLKGMCPRRS